MRQKLKKLFFTATFRQTSLTTISSVINGVLGAAFYFLLARLLGNIFYGQFSLVTTAITTLAGVADLGSDQALIKFAHQGDSYTKAVFYIKLTSSLFLLAFLLIIFPNWLGLLLGFGVFTQLIFSFTVSLSQSRQDYRSWALLLIGTNLLRFIFLLGSLTNIRFLSASLIYIICPLIGFLVFFTLKNFSFLKSAVSRSVFTHIFTFNKWVTAFILVNTIGSKLDLFLTARFTNIASTGVYALATQLVAILPQLTTALGAVTAPKFASFNHPQANQNYLKKSLLFSFAIAILASALMIVFAMLVIKFTGHDFSQSWQPFLILLAGMDIFLITTPLRDSILYYYSDAPFFFWSGLFQIVVTLTLSQILIPSLKLTGSSLTVLSSQLLLAGLVINQYIYLRKIHVQK